MHVISIVFSFGDISDKQATPGWPHMENAV